MKHNSNTMRFIDENYPCQGCVWFDKCRDLFLMCTQLQKHINGNTYDVSKIKNPTKEIFIKHGQANYDRAGYKAV